MMDILRPELMWIDNVCYRVNPVKNDNNTVEQQQIKNEYIEEDLYASDNDDCIDNEYEVIEVRPDKFESSFHVPNACFGSIIGAKGATIRRLQNETKADIKIPRSNNNEDVRISGKTRDAVCEARRRIEEIVNGIRQKRPFTHFTAVKITDSIREKCLKFQDDILNGDFLKMGLSEKMFIVPKKLHVTICMMHLMDDQDRLLADQLLESCHEKIIVPIKEEYGKIVVHFRGFEIMNDDPSSVNVLYAKVESEALQKIADGITQQFMKSGLTKRQHERDNVKLHMTLINTRKANEDDSDQINAPKKIKALKFDARHILENYGDLDFGSQELHEIQLAILKTTDELDGFYKCRTHIKF